MSEGSIIDIKPFISERLKDAFPSGSGFSDPSITIPFTFGFPDPESFPMNEVIAATEQVMKEEGRLALQYGGIHGPDRLIEYLIGKAKRDDGITVSTPNLMVTNGGSQAFSLYCFTFLNPGDIIIAEAPSFIGALNILRHYQARVISIPLDKDGMQVDLLENVLAGLQREGEKPKFIYTIPTFHNPAGVTMSLERRVKLLELAERYDIMIAEDDAYTDLRYEGESFPTLLSMDKKGLVTKLCSFSKILAAGLRLGWAVGRPDIITRLSFAKHDQATSPFAARVAAQYIHKGLIEPHIHELIGVYRNKRDTMLSAMAEHFPTTARWEKPAGGFYVWVELPKHLDSREIAAMAAREGVGILPGPECFADRGGANYFRLAFSFLPSSQIAEGIKRLGNVIKAAERGS